MGNIFNFWLVLEFLILFYFCFNFKILKFNFNFDIINFYIFNSFGGFVLFILAVNLFSNFTFSILVLVCFKFNFVPFEKLNFIILKSFDFSYFINVILKIKILFCFILVLNIFYFNNFSFIILAFILTILKNFNFILNLFYNKILILQLNRFYVYFVLILVLYFSFNFILVSKIFNFNFINQILILVLILVLLRLPFVPRFILKFILVLGFNFNFVILILILILLSYFIIKLTFNMILLF